MAEATQRSLRVALLTYTYLVARDPLSRAWFPEPDQCAMQGVDFGQPVARPPSRPVPRAPVSLRELVRGGWPIAATFALMVLVAGLLIPGRSPPPKR